MFDDLGEFLTAEGPYVKVFDHDLTPNHILVTSLKNNIRVRWGFSGTAIGLLPVLTFTVNVYAQPIGPGGDTVPLGPVTVSSPSTPLTVDIPIDANALPAGVYHLTTVISTTAGPFGPSLPIAGFHEGPAIEMRNP